MEQERCKGAEKTHPEIEDWEIRYKIRYRIKEDRIFCQQECGHLQIVNPSLEGCQREPHHWTTCWSLYHIFV